MSLRSVLARFLWVGLTAFGAARWTNLHAAFVRVGAISEADFARDFAIAQTLPGASFVNLAALCGMRLGGVRVAVLGLALLMLPGILAIVAAMAYLSTSEGWVTRLFHGILVGAVGALAAGYVRASRSLRGRFDATLAVSTLLLIVAGVPLFATVGVALFVGVLWNRWSSEP